MKSYSLVIIDMQRGFLAARQPSLKEPILREIALARKYNRQIVVAHFAGYGRTNDYILKALKGYTNKVFVRKTTDDGSDEVVKVLQNNNVRICGVQSSVCVFETAYSLKNYYHINNTPINVFLVKDACGDYIKKNARQTKGNDYTLDTFPEAQNCGLNILYPNRQQSVVYF